MTDTKPKIRPDGLPEDWPEKLSLVISNPPYQAEAVGKARNMPLYHKFMEKSYNISDKVMVITPGRFLFNAGATPKEFNKNRLSDEHFKVINFYTNSNDVFDDVDIKGGIAITYRDSKKQFSPIINFIGIPTLNSIYSKIKPYLNETLADIWFGQSTYKFSKLGLETFSTPPSVRHLSSTCLSNDAIFKDHPIDEDDAKIFGRLNEKRVVKWINQKYLDTKDVNSFEKYKVFIPKANGSGAIGEVLSTPVMGVPVMGHTGTFISLGAFDTEYEAKSLMLYLKSKFSRALLSIKKITQDNGAKETWSTIPLQDFTPESDVPWDKSIPEIDEYLFDKYNLSDEEKEFIRTNVKEML